MNILHVNTTDISGGAEVVTVRLHEQCRARGHQSWIAVGRKRSADPDIFEMDSDRYRNAWARSCIRVAKTLDPLRGKLRGAGRLFSWMRLGMAEPRRYRAIQRGKEDFHFPATWQLLTETPERPDLLHLHNLHQNYFDLRALPWLSRQCPVFITLHDTWMLSGHCAYSLDCDRWKIQCGDCPDLNLYPRINKDATASNWRRKEGIFSRSNLYVATPSRWMMNRLEQSMLAPGVAEARLIPNGVDLSVFTPGDKLVSRSQLDISPEARVVLFVASRIRHHQFKDFETLRAAVYRAAARMTNAPVLFIVLGEKAPPAHVGNLEMRFVAFETQPQTVAHYYRAADVYAHAAKADTFPLAVLEAMACATPVVATAVGGVPEQVMNGETGFLVPPADPAAMAQAIVELLSNKAMRDEFGIRSAEIAAERFSLDLMATEYLQWYEDVISRHSSERPVISECV